MKSIAVKICCYADLLGICDRVSDGFVFLFCSVSFLFFFFFDEMIYMT